MAISTHSIQDLIEHVEALPPSARILTRLQKLLRSDDASHEDIIALLRVDPALTAHVMRLSNSACFSGGQSCEGLVDAVQRLGFQTVYELVATAVAQEILDVPLPLFSLRRGELMIRSITLAFFLTRLRRLRRIADASDALYTAGLLHGIGKVAINQYFRTKGFEFFDLADDTLLAAGEEKHWLGYEHPEAGAGLLEFWKFSPAIVGLIRHQASPALAGGLAPLARMMETGLGLLDALLDPDCSPAEVAERAEIAGAVQDGEDWGELVTGVRTDLAALTRSLSSQSGTT